MALNGTGNDWGDDVVAAIESLNPEYDTELDASEKSTITSFWRAICTVHEDHLIANVDVQTTSGAPDSEHTGVIQ